MAGLAALLFSLVAAAGPLYCLFNNWYLTGDALDFFRGPYSARAIQGSAFYPGKGDWRMAWLYYRTAAWMCAGPGLALMGGVGLAAALAKRAFWPRPAAGASGRVLHLEHAFLRHADLRARDVAEFLLQHPLWLGRAAAAGGGRGRPWWPWTPRLAPAGGVSGRRGRQRALVAPSPAVELGHLGGIAHQFRSAPRVDPPGRRIPGVPLPARLRHHDIVRRHERASTAPRASRSARPSPGDNGLPWLAAVRRPELFVWQEWAVAMAGDAVDAALAPGRSGGLYRLEKSIEVKGAPAIHIYRRAGGMHGPS